MVRMEIKKEYNRYSAKIALRTQIVLSAIFLKDKVARIIFFFFFGLLILNNSELGVC